MATLLLTDSEHKSCWAIRGYLYPFSENNLLTTTFTYITQDSHKQIRPALFVLCCVVDSWRGVSVPDDSYYCTSRSVGRKPRGRVVVVWECGFLLVGDLADGGV
jgi:hypothetical protein